MFRKLILIGLCMIFMGGLVSAELCYQESANVSTECGGLDSGVYIEYTSNSSEGNWTNFSYTIDGDWDTWGYKSGIGYFAVYLYINYTKPDNVLNSSLWQVKDDGGSENLTIPASCWDYDENKLIFRVESFSIRSDADALWLCYDGGWTKQLRVSPYHTHIYEEAMWWNITEEEEPPIPIKYNHTRIFGNTHLAINSGGRLRIST